MTLSAKLAEIAQISPNQEAIVFKSLSMTYAQLNTRVNQLAGGLKQMGIHTGDRVMLVMRNCPEFVIACYAIMRMQGIVVPVSPQFTVNELSMIIQDCLPTAIITSPEKQAILSKISQSINIPKGIIVNSSKPAQANIKTLEQICDHNIDTYQGATANQADAAEIFYIDGLSGQPRGVILTNHNLYSNALAFSQACSLSQADHALLTAQAYYAGAQTCVMNATLVSGGLVVIQEGFNGAEELLRNIAQEKITFLFGPPTLYNLLSKYPDLPKFNTSSLRLALSSSAGMSANLYQSLVSRLKIQIANGYGLTETSPMITLNFINKTGKIGSVGKPIPDVAVKIVDYQEREVPQGQVGEIVVSGPNVMKGYLNQEEETRYALRGGWFHTGDLAYADQDGFLYLVDRKKNIIVRAGVNIRPHEIEEVLYDHPGIFEVAVIGVPDARVGEEILAYIMPRSKNVLSESEIMAFCRDRLDPHKIPRYFCFVDNLPKTSSGKLMRKEMQSWIAKQKPPV